VTFVLEQLGDVYLGHLGFLERLGDVFSLGSWVTFFLSGWVTSFLGQLDDVFFLQSIKQLAGWII
jgi:hypothetical protein